MRKEHLKQCLCLLLCSLSYMMCLLVTGEVDLNPKGLQLTQAFPQAASLATTSLCSTLFLCDSFYPDMTDRHTAHSKVR